MKLVVDDLILASSSPARLSLLKQIGVTPSAVVDPCINEEIFPDESPKQYAERVANTKVSSVVMKYPGKYVLSADTVVCCGSRIIPKATTEAIADKCLRVLSGRRHRVITVVSLFSVSHNRIISRSSVSLVKFKRLTDNDIHSYLDSNEWLNKAAGCCLQGFASKFVVWMRGSYTGCIGLPLYETACLLSSV